MPKVTRQTPLTGKTKSGKILTEQEELFCNMYVEHLGNGTAAAEEAYNVDKEKSNWRNTCSQMANENLRKPHILERVREILDLTQLNDETVDSELNFLIKQSAELPAKAKGIDIYNKIRGRYQEDKTNKVQTALLTEIYGRLTKGKTDRDPSGIK